MENNTLKVVAIVCITILAITIVIFGKSIVDTAIAVALLCLVVVYCLD